MKILYVRLDDETEAMLRAVCERTGWSQTQAVKAGISALAASTRRSPAEIAHDLGLVGCFESEEGDLAGNHSERIRERLAGR